MGVAYQRQTIVGVSIFESPIHADFLLTNIVAFPQGLAVESKWQHSDGSIDEKFPCLVDNILHQYTVPAVVVIHGGKCRPGALAWLLRQIDGEHLIAVLSLEEFMKWAMQAQKRDEHE